MNLSEDILGETEIMTVGYSDDFLDKIPKTHS